MSGLAYALISFAVLYVIGWYVSDERSDPNHEGAKGLLAMSAQRRNRPLLKWRASVDSPRAKHDERQIKNVSGSDR